MRWLTDRRMVVTLGSISGWSTSSQAARRSRRHACLGDRVPAQPSGNLSNEWITQSARSLQFALASLVARAHCGSDL